MAQPTLSERLDHICETIEQIEANTGGMTLDSYRADRFRQLGVERALEIISEASRHIPDDVKSQHPEIPCRRVADIGNRLRHAYHSVDAEIVWEILSNELSTLKAAINSMRR